MTAEQKIMKAKVQLLLENPFFATLALKMEYVEDKTVGTACTNGKRIKYNPDFIDKLDVEETKMVIAHECLHPGLMHHTRRQGRNAKKWNYAVDFPVNELLKESGFKLIKGALLDPQFSNMGAEEIYNKLPDMPDDEDGSGEGNDPGGCGGVEDAPAKTQSEIAQMESEAKQDLAQAAAMAKQQGKLPAGLERFVNEALKPKVNWKEVLSAYLTETIKSDYTFKKPNSRHLHAGLYLSSLSSIETGTVVLLVDTSGSICERTLNQFAAEMQDILGVFNRGFDIVYVDSEVAGVQHIDPDDTFKLEPKGGGGTDFVPGFEWIDENDVEPSAIVYLTDGYCNSFPKDPGCPVMWAVIDNDNFKPPFGEVVGI
jgi:predicted metal-dependent peptidase